MQMYEDAAAIGEITVTPEWVIRHVCNTMIGAMVGSLNTFNV